MTEIDLGRETSNLLVEVRTVHSRAWTALHGYRSDASWISESEFVIDPGDYDYVDGQQVYTRPRVAIPHPDRDEIRAALEKVVELLDPWRRTGRPAKK